MQRERDNQHPTHDLLPDSDTLLRAMVENLPGGATFVVDRNLRYLLAEGEALATAGFKPEDFVGRTIFEVLPPELIASYEPRYRQALAGEPFEQEHSVHVRGASPQENRCYISRGTPLRSANGDVYGVMVVSYDITERKRVEDQRNRVEDERNRVEDERKHAEVALRESEARLQAVANLVPDLLWDSEPNGSTNWYNQRWMEYTGQTFEQAIGWGWIDAIHPDDREGSARRYREAVEQGMLLQQEHRIRRRDGAYRWFVVKAAPLKDESGKVIKMYGAATDIHDRKQAEDALRESEEKYRSLFESIDEGFCIFEMIYDENSRAVDYRFVEVNPVFERQTGLNNVVGKLGSEIAPNTERYWLETYDHVLKTGTPQRIKNYNQATDRWYSAYASRIGDGGSRQVCTVFSDITERKRNEQRQAFLLQLSDTLRSLSDAVEIHAAVTRIAMNFFGADRCYYCEIIDGNAIIRRDASREGLPSVAGVYPLSAFPIFKAVIDAGRPLVVEDAHTADVLDEALRQLCCEMQVISFIDVPVIKEGEPAGVLCITQTTPRNWTALETELVQETAERIWAAVERARAEAQLRRAAEIDAFRVKLSDALRPLSDPVVLQETAMQVLGTHLGVNRAFYGEVLDDDTLVIGPGYSNELFPIVGQIKFSEFDSDLLTDYHAGRTVVINDLYMDVQLSAKAKTEFDAIQVRAAVGVALVKNEKVRAILSIHQSVPRQWTPSEIILLEETADRTWAAVERARTEVDLRKLEIERVREQAAHEEERQRAEALAELDRAKTLFFSNISHEFRTPLTLSLAPLQDALSDRTHPLDAVHRERLELVHRNNLRLLKLVNTLLDFSRIEAGRMEAVYEPTDLALFTTELASVFRSAIERAGLQLIVDCPPLPEPVFIDREMWEKIVLNLLSNAFKFTFEGVVTVRLRSANSNQAVLQIQDTGSGIAPEHLPHLFERFYQVRGTQARTHEGSGIGLALVHELVRLHDGTIEVSSTVGEGTCFTITLTFGTEHLPSDRLPVRTLASTAMGATSYVEEAERWLPTGDPPQPRFLRGEDAIKVPLSKGDLGGSPEPEASPISSACVLLVDDNADMREYLTRILGKHVQVEAVADGATALAVAQARVPDLILSDVMMPGLDGFELLEALRTNPRTREIPIILLSARAGAEAIVEGLGAGADDYLIKPFSAQELVSRVIAHLQMSQLRGEALQQARSTLRSRDEFISVVSHELNTPLVSILGWIRILRSSPPNPVMLNKALDTIERNATLQGKLVQDLLDLSRITAGKLRLHLQPIELQSVIETAIATVAQTATDKRIEFTWQENTTESVVVMGDGDRLSQVLINLLTNAIKFTPESGRVRVELSVMNTGSTNASYAEIRVIDTGIGIAANFLPHVFDRFSQAQGANAAKGLGLGLAIAYHIVELHHGTIHAHSAGEGQGTTFTVRLPLLQDSER